jgi:ATP-binding cassette subfamily F protein uup
MDKQKAESRKQKAENCVSTSLNPQKQKTEEDPTVSKLTWKENRELEQLEIEIPKLEQEIETLLQKMNSGNGTSQELNEWGNTCQNISNEIDAKTMRWLELSEKKM